MRHFKVRVEFWIQCRISWRKPENIFNSEERWGELVQIEIFFSEKIIGNNLILLKVEWNFYKDEKNTISSYEREIIQTWIKKQDNFTIDASLKNNK